MKDFLMNIGKLPKHNVHKNITFGQQSVGSYPTEKFLNGKVCE